MIVNVNASDRMIERHVRALSSIILGPVYKVSLVCRLEGPRARMWPEFDEIDDFSDATGTGKTKFTLGRNAAGMYQESVNASILWLYVYF